MNRPGKSLIAASPGALTVDAYRPLGTGASAISVARSVLTGAQPKTLPPAATLDASTAFWVDHASGAALYIAAGALSADAMAAVGEDAEGSTLAALVDAPRGLAPTAVLALLRTQSIEPFIALLSGRACLMTRAHRACSRKIK